jgi:hypothetical protein
VVVVGADIVNAGIDENSKTGGYQGENNHQANTVALDMCLHRPATLVVAPASAPWLASPALASANADAPCS